MYHKKKVDAFLDVRKLFFEAGLIKMNDNSLQCFEGMNEKVMFINRNRIMIVKDYLSKDSELKRFLAVHGDVSVRTLFTGRFTNGPVKISEDSDIWKILDVFEGGQCILHEIYPDINITYESGMFKIEDKGFECDKVVNTIEDWRSAPVYLL